MKPHSHEFYASLWWTNYVDHRDLTQRYCCIEVPRFGMPSFSRSRCQKQIMQLHGLHGLDNPCQQPSQNFPGSRIVANSMGVKVWAAIYYPCGPVVLGSSSSCPPPRQAALKSHKSMRGGKIRGQLMLL